MEIGREVIRTPYDAPFGYEPEWRYLVARAAVESDSHVVLPPDEALRAQVTYLRHALDGGVGRRYNVMGMVRGDTTRRAQHLANAIYQYRDENCFKHKLDALLLCPELNLQQLSQLTGQDPEVLLAYSRTFFDVRDAQFAVSLSPWMRDFFTYGGRVANPDPNDATTYWKALSLSGGYKVLLTSWGWRLPGNELPESDINLMVFRNLLINLDKRIRDGKLDGKASMDMLGRMKELIDDMRARGVISADGAGGDTETSVVLKLLYDLRPIPVKVDQAQSEELYGTAVQQKLAAIKSKVTGGKSSDPSLPNNNSVSAQLATMSDKS